MNLFRKFISSQTFIFFHQKRIPPLVKKSEYCDKKLLKTSSTMHMKEQKGFTLIELLIVIALIAILAAAVIIGLNPARQFAQARNSQRWSHVNALLNAVNQNVAEHNGTWTCTGATPIPATATNMDSTVTGFNLCSCLVTTYMSSMPFDPSTTGAGYTDCTTYNTGYTIAQNATTGRISVAAPGAEISASISVSN
ncbi:MAG: hypothetical protein UT32_C0024G0010 [Parcubacteria group bacterium GW2011_GWC2_39_14]|nr:MAG: hypothetical protein UT32_C0024G0010 [Parcubacteria group bacterium GW2011_GWC2_39_14]